MIESINAGRGASRRALLLAPLGTPYELCCCDLSGRRCLAEESVSEILTPGQMREKSITVHTREGTPIPNGQSYEYSAWDISVASGIEKKYKDVKCRTDLNPIYNCFGLVFASRRTSISDLSSIPTILNEDGYTEIPRSEVLPGDLVLYRGRDGDVEHAGIVVSREDFYLSVVSKWGRFREVVHWAHEGPYDGSDLHFYRVTQ